MTDTDIPEFMTALKKVMVVFNIRQDPDVLSEAYFKALRPFPIQMVVDGGERCTTKLKRFPKPIEWAEMVPRPSAPGVPEMSKFEASDYLEAESFFYEMPPCGCGLCRQAGISDKPIRYVPDDDEPKGKIGERVVVRGHSAHGFELKRYYAAKEAFWAKARSLGYKSSLLNPPARVDRKRSDLVAVGGGREPGEDG